MVIILHLSTGQSWIVLDCRWYRQALVCQLAGTILVVFNYQNPREVFQRKTEGGPDIFVSIRKIR